jgi:LysM repeat protein
VNGRRRAEHSNQKIPAAQINASRETATAHKWAGRTVPADVQKLVDSSHAFQGGSSKSLSNGSAQEGAGESAKVYVVQKGDSPAGISKKFKVSYADLLRANNISDPKKLQIGQKLAIP